MAASFSTRASQRCLKWLIITKSNKNKKKYKNNNDTVRYIFLFFSFRRVFKLIPTHRRTDCIHYSYYSYSYIWSSQRRNAMLIPYQTNEKNLIAFEHSIPFHPSVWWKRCVQQPFLLFRSLHFYSRMDEINVCDSYFRRWETLFTYNMWHLNVFRLTEAVLHTHFVILGRDYILDTRIPDFLLYLIGGPFSR